MRLSAFGIMAAFVAAATTFTFASDTKKPVTIDDLVKQHPPTIINPIWAPDNSAFAYVQKKTLYLFKISERKPKVWFDLSVLEKAAKKPTESPAETKSYVWRNRRVSSDSYQWFPDSKHLLAAVNGDLFVIHANGKYDQITATEIDEEDPKLSPDGKQVLYRWNSNLYVIDLSVKSARQLTSDGNSTLLNGELDWVYPEELDLGTAAWWSPDSKQIAYLQFNVADEFLYPQADMLGRRAVSEPERYPQAGTPNALVKLGVIAVAGGTTKWMQVGNTSDTLLARIAWLPDSSAIAVERLPRVQNALDLLFCDAGTGTAHTVLQEQSKDWINVTDNLYFLKSRPEFIWTSERSGFRHIYRYSFNGELLRQLTSGDWEASSIAAIDETKQRVYYISSETSPLESQLYSVDFNAGDRTRLTDPGATHQIQANSDGSYYLDAFSNLKRPPEVVLRSANGEQVAVLQRADTHLLDEYNVLPAEIVEVKTADGITLYARLVKPAGFTAAEKYPAIVYVYGGPEVQSVRNMWYGLNWEQVLAHRGYVVWQLDNRGSKGRGHAFEAVIFHQLGKQEVADQRLGVQHLIQMGFVDANRIGITGWSYGGYMTIHSLLLAPDVFKVGVAGAPVTDWHNYDTIYTERYMGVPQENKAGYDASSNVQNARGLNGKLLIVHNFEDDNVLFQNSMQMVNALEKADKEYVMQVYPEKTHGVTGPLRKPMYQMMTDFFDEHFRSGR